MRIVEPQKNSVSSKSDKKKSNRKPLFVLILALIIGLVILNLFVLKDDKDNSEITQNTIQEPTVNGTSDNNTVVEETNTSLFIGNQIRIFYDQLRQRNTNKIPLPPPITGNDIADTKIREIAESRGYRLRTQSTTTLPFLFGYRLQPDMQESWLDLQESAKTEGLAVSIVSGFRSIEEQRQLFVSRLSAQGVSTNDIINGKAAAGINEVLKTTAIPGYSKHHSGYTVDLLCAGTLFDDFYKSPCNEWLTAENYKNALNFGFIPSYPEDADLQGPNPEAWEYVWVGTEALNTQ